MTATTHAPPLEQRRAFRTAVLRFYRRHKRDLPWRRTRDPYRILVSEVMLQQTQAARVITAYERFLARFPTLRSLARARSADVVRVWLGLGYNVRAVRLWRCAREVVAAHRGVLPRDPAQLRRLPGIGDYTASAVAAIAFGAALTVVDVNVRRVLARVFTGRDQIGKAHLDEIARAAMPASSAGEWAQALMDLGSMHCRAQPHCTQCPVRHACMYPNARQAAARRPTAGAPRVFRTARFVGSTRYYRGRVVHALSTQGTFSMRALGRKVKDGFALSDLPWLRELLHGLERDGLVRVQRGRVRIG